MATAKPAAVAVKPTTAKPKRQRLASVKETTAKPAESSPPDQPAPAAPKLAPPADRLHLIAEGLREKSSAKQAIFRATQAAFTLLRQVSQQLCLELTQRVTTEADPSVRIECLPVS